MCIGKTKRLHAPGLRDGCTIERPPGRLFACRLDLLRARMYPNVGRIARILRGVCGSQIWMDARGDLLLPERPATAVVCKRNGLTFNEAEAAEPNAAAALLHEKGLRDNELQPL